jgi:hypothetical protein
VDNDTFEIYLASSNEDMKESVGYIREDNFGT